MRQPSVMPSQRQFATVPTPRITRSKFDRSHGIKTTADVGKLYPFLVDEMLPGDTFNLHATLYGRLNTMLFPIMDNLFLDTFYFNIPLRLVWNNFQRFMGEQDNPEDSIDFLIPRLLGSEGSVEFQYDDLADYFGLPTNQLINETNHPIAALFFRAYNKTWNQWFRDQNFQPSLAVPMDDGPDDQNIYHIQRRGKRHDYFTSSLPSPQKGPAVTISLAQYAPVIGTGEAMGLRALEEDNVNIYNDYRLSAADYATNAGTTQTYLAAYRSSPVGGTVNAGDGVLGFASDKPRQLRAVGLTPNPDLSGAVADLSSVSVLTINELRSAVAIQQLLELYMRGGTRYVELLKSEFDVVSPDARLQRVEYLGGGSHPVSVNPVPQTAPAEGAPLASLAAYGTVTAPSGFTYSSTEHSIIIGLFSIRADITYQQRIERMWSRRTRYDFFHPLFQNLGEQAVFNREINFTVDINPDYPGEVWGYQERYAEYRYKPSYVTGKMRSNTPGGSLDAWHLALDFNDLPVYLGSTFIEDDPPLPRAVAVTDEPQFYIDIYNRYHCVRPMSMRSIPGLNRF